MGTGRRVCKTPPPFLGIANCITRVMAPTFADREHIRPSAKPAVKLSSTSSAITAARSSSTILVHHGQNITVVSANLGGRLPAFLGLTAEERGLTCVASHSVCNRLITV